MGVTQSSPAFRSGMNSSSLAVLERNREFVETCIENSGRSVEFLNQLTNGVEMVSSKGGEGAETVEEVLHRARQGISSIMNLDELEIAGSGDGGRVCVSLVFCDGAFGDLRALERGLGRTFGLMGVAAVCLIVLLGIGAGSSG